MGSGETRDHAALLAAVPHDPVTYRPVMVTGPVASGLNYIQRFDYLPRTPANLALLVTPLPPGSALVGSLDGEAERLVVGCTP